MFLSVRSSLILILFICFGISAWAQDRVFIDKAGRTVKIVWMKAPYNFEKTESNLFSDAFSAAYQHLPLTLLKSESLEAFGANLFDRDVRIPASQNPEEWLVAKASINEQTVGLAAFKRIAKEEWYLSLIGVHPKLQRAGIASQLIESLKKHLDNLGLPIKSLTLDTRIQNLGAVELYKNLGFRIDCSAILDQNMPSADAVGFRLNY